MLNVNCSMEDPGYQFGRQACFLSFRGEDEESAFCSVLKLISTHNEFGIGHWFGVLFL